MTQHKNFEEFFSANLTVTQGFLSKNTLNESRSSKAGARNIKGT